jgi:hypothetical protein
MRSSVAWSKPLVALTNAISGVRCGNICVYSERAWFDGITPSTMRAPASASAKLLVTSTSRGISTPGRKTSFTRVARMRSQMSFS